MKQSSRRKFIKHTTLAAGAALTLPRAARAIGENEKITVGIIGPGGMGSAHLGALCGNKAVNIAYVCDVDERRAAKARATAEKAKGKAPKVVGDMQWPDTQNCLFEYAPDKAGRVKQLIFEMRIWSPYKQEGKENGNAFYGTKGMMVLGKKEGWQLYRERNELVKQGGGGPDLGGHHRDFIDCIRNGKRPRADIETGHLSSSLCHLGNIAIRTGEMLHFDPAKERMVENAKADKLVRREYRKHWGTPKGV